MSGKKAKKLKPFPRFDTDEEANSSGRHSRVARNLQPSI
jgi:hypothetical protein